MARTKLIRGWGSRVAYLLDLLFGWTWGRDNESRLRADDYECFGYEEVAHDFEVDFINEEE